MWRLRGTCEEGFTLMELLVVTLIIGILTAIAIPNYLGQQQEAKDSAAMAQLRTAATSQDLYHAKLNAFAANITDLEAYGFRQGGQSVTVVAADASTYCMQAPGGTDTFKMTQDTGRPVSGTC
jgi:prepilin-type N-terminal cleavage/methylation domain-containing protein